MRDQAELVVAEVDPGRREIAGAIRRATSAIAGPADRSARQHERQRAGTGQAIPSAASVAMTMVRS